MKASLIISVYDNIPFLKAVLDTLPWQTERDFEVIISEDAEHPEVAQFVSQYPFVNPVQHLTQPDTGWRKELALNRAIMAAQSDWLVFIDGDCLLHPRFMEEHIRLASDSHILAGKRLRLTPELSQRLLSGELDVRQMPAVVRRSLLLGGRGLKHIEEAFYLAPDSLMGRLFAGRKNRTLTGCNMSCSRQTLLRVNGFDEDYVHPATGEDADLLWRLQGIGVGIRSVRNLAVQYHLWHRLTWTDQTENFKIMHRNQAAHQYICKNGIQKR